MHNLFHMSKEQQSTPLERLRGSTVQPVKSCEFGVVGCGKPQKEYPEHRGKRLVRSIYVGPQGANGVEFDKGALDLLVGNKEDPERPLNFDLPPDLPAPPEDPPALSFLMRALSFPLSDQEKMRFLMRALVSMFLHCLMKIWVMKLRVLLMTMPRWR